MEEQQSSYRNIMKATSLFGGVQVFNIIIQIIRSKVVAVLLGPAGIGIIGLFTATISIIGSLTNFGLSTSAVKDIASAFSTGEEKQIGIVVTAFRRLVWVTGVVGLIVSAVFSPWISQLTFGNKNYTFAFIWLSFTFLFNQLSSGQLVLLQGLRKLNYLAKANIYGSVIGLIITLPLYYIWGINGIVPGIISTALISLMISWYFSRKVKIESTVLSIHQTITEGKSMLRMGFMISLSGLLAIGASYIVRVYINRLGGVEQVGLFTAGFAIINTYVGLIFNAMSTDYYPRLSAVAHDDKLCKQTINQQAEIAILILSPILIVFFVFIKWLIILLYSNQFIGISGMIYWAALGMFFKTATWAMGFILLAKSESKIFFLSELVSSIIALIFNLIGYKLWGLTGLGISFFIAYIIAFCQVFFICKIKYKFSFDLSFVRLFIFQFVLALLAFFSILYLTNPYSIVIGIVLILISVWSSVTELDKRLGLNSLLKNYLKK